MNPACVWSMSACAVADVSRSHSRPAVSAKNWLVPRARAASRPRSRASSSVRASSVARRTKTLGTPMRLSLECTELLTLAMPWLFMPSMSRYGAPASPMTRVPSGPVRSKRTLLTASITYQSMLWPTTWRSPATTATAVQWSPERGEPGGGAAPTGSSDVNSSPQLRTSRRAKGTRAPSARPSSSST